MNEKTYTHRGQRIIDSRTGEIILDHGDTYPSQNGMTLNDIVNYLSWLIEYATKDTDDYYGNMRYSFIISCANAASAIQTILSDELIA